MNLVVREKAIIVDLDGTLCNIDHRLKFVKQTPKDWPSFFRNIAGDAPNEWCRQLVYSVFKKHKVIFVSGRNDAYRKVTQHWLLEHMGETFVIDCPLFMRKDEDFRQDAIIKEEIYRAEIEPKFEILFCVDDRKQVVDMWRRIGLHCLHCAEGDF